MVPQIGGWRALLVPKVEPNFYPAIMQKEEYERLKKQAKVTPSLLECLASSISENFLKL